MRIPVVVSLLSELKFLTMWPEETAWLHNQMGCLIVRHVNNGGKGVRWKELKVYSLVTPLTPSICQYTDFWPASHWASVYCLAFSVKVVTLKKDVRESLVIMKLRLGTAYLGHMTIVRFLLFRLTNSYMCCLCGYYGE